MEGNFVATTGPVANAPHVSRVLLVVDDVQQQDQFVHQPEFGFLCQEFLQRLSPFLVAPLPDGDYALVHGFVGGETEEEFVGSFGDGFFL